ncbi:hypothetical protein GF407_05555 [candidate division KSB1 bacterium]|nr:hypothetical protein [candidate division KSB1 bacterium]
MKKIMIASLLVFVFTTTSAFADSGSFIGLRGGLYTDVEEPFIGAEYLTGIGPSVDFNPNIEYVFIDNMTYMTFNIDAHYDFYNRRGGFIYFGAGLGISYVDIDGAAESETDTGLNLLAGGGLSRGSVIPYIQVKMILGDNDELVVGFGLRF